MRLAAIVAGVVLVGLSASACNEPNPPVEQSVCINTNTGETLDPSLCQSPQDNSGVEIEIDVDKHKNPPPRPPSVRTLPKYTPPPAPSTNKPTPIPVPPRTVQPPAPAKTVQAPPPKPRR